jgi:Zn-dependent protease
MHKFVAQKYGLWAEFRAFYPMLFLSIALSFAGFIIAAPGAVVIKGKVNKEKNGKISLAGPLTNIILSLIFLIPFLLIKTQGTLKLFFIYGLTINSLLAFFNLLPVLFFDGLKIYKWNKTIYFILLISAVIMFILSYFL